MELSCDAPKTEADSFHVNKTINLILRCFQHFYKAVFKNASTSSEPEVQSQEGRQELWGSRVTDWKHSELNEILKCLQETWDQSSYLKSDSLVSVFEFLNLIMNESRVRKPGGTSEEIFSKSDQNKYFPSCVKCSCLIGHKMPLVVKMNITKTNTNYFFSPAKTFFSMFILFNLFPQIVKNSPNYFILLWRIFYFFFQFENV